MKYSKESNSHQLKLFLLILNTWASLSKW